MSQFDRDIGVRNLVLQKKEADRDYVLVWWFKEVVQPKLRGYAGLVVYADDFVVCFQYKSDAEQFYERLKHRMGYFGLRGEHFDRIKPLQ